MNLKTLNLGIQVKIIARSYNQAKFFCYNEKNQTILIYDGK